MEGYRASTYGDGFADVYDDWYGGLAEPRAVGRFVAQRCGTGPVVELGSGTGLVAAGLADAGLRVIGLDASVAMLSRSCSAHPTIPVVAADMASPPIGAGTVGAVVVAFNTLFNVPTPELQRRCLGRVASMLAPDGVLVVEAFVPNEVDSEHDTTRDHVDVVRLDADSVVLRVSRTDRDEGTVFGHHVELRDGEPVRLRPWHLRYLDPAGLDRLATAAGLTRRERFSSWHETPFEATSDSHVSVFGPTRARQ